MKFLIGAAGLFLMVISAAAARLFAQTPDGAYYTELGVLILGSIMLIFSGAIQQLSWSISNSTIVFESIFENSTGFDNVKKTALVMLGVIIFILAFWMFNEASHVKAMPDLFGFHIMAYLISLGVLVYGVHFPERGTLDKDGFDDAIGQHKVVRLATNQYLYLKPTTKHASWKLYFPDTPIILTNRRYFVLNTKNFQAFKSVPKIFIEAEDSYVDASFQVRINQDKLNEIPALDEKTLTILGNVSDELFMANLLMGSAGAFDKEVSSAKQYFHTTQRNRVDDPLNYYHNHSSMHDALQNFVKLGDILKAKAMEFVQKKFRTEYLKSRNMVFDIFDIKVVLTYVVGNKNFNMSVLNEINQFISNLQDINYRIEREERKMLLEGMIRVSEVLGLEESIDKLENLLNQAGNGNPKYQANQSNKKFEATSPTSTLLPVQKPIALPSQTLQIPASTVDPSELKVAARELKKFMEDTELHNEHLATNLKGYVRSAIFSKYQLNYNVLADNIFDKGNRKPDGTINISNLEIILKQHVNQSRG